jgi:hypothetical protein
VCDVIVTSSTECSSVARPSASISITCQVFLESVIVSTVWVVPFIVVSVTARWATAMSIRSPARKR